VRDFAAAQVVGGGRGHADDRVGRAQPTALEALVEPPLRRLDRLGRLP
jgi:hypothetical protein